ncbi:hypothetical protein [Mucisphaera calidilacus]|uniref:Uncharacterized protein n=1 Tax=Mucisphaera calidilacus TaxID=2527982 RepID=A0A518BXX0_9BACT|nr:hypothetical protein [Mucisphaera calidilacus]QDU71829.1 hypothetical protein Pan265_16820 [Mucisphaera calidilacus]
MSGNHESDYDRDVEHIKLLSIFHYIVGGLCCLFASVFLFYIIMGLTLILAPVAIDDLPMPAPILGLIVLLLGSIPLISGWTIGILTILSGRSMRAFRARTFSIIIACVSCLFIPLGTILGVFTLIVLTRRSVVERYNNPQHTA